MRSLYLRIWLTVVAALALFALVSGWMWQRHLDDERSRFEQVANERLAAWAEVVQRSLPEAAAPTQAQGEAVRAWSERLHVPLALDAADGSRIAASDSFERRQSERNRDRHTLASVQLDDGRTLHLLRRVPSHLRERRLPPPAGGPGADEAQPLGTGLAGPVDAVAEEREEHRRNAGHSFRPRPPDEFFALPFSLPVGIGPLVLVAMLFIAVAAGAYPVVRRLTRRLEALKQGVATFGAGDLSARVDVAGSDEVAAVAATFNRSAERIETLVRSHKSLLANASHELRSPLARLKMAVAMLADSPPQQAASLHREINTNIGELDVLVEEVLLASRLDAGSPLDLSEPVDLLGIAAEEAARTGAEVSADPGGHWQLQGNDRLLRRALRNLLENASRYAGGDVLVQVSRALAGGGFELLVCDRGPGVPASARQQIFEPYFRLPGHAEREGGVGLGLSLVRQIVQAHGGRVVCEPREGGGSCFRISLPAR